MLPDFDRLFTQRPHQDSLLTAKGPPFLENWFGKYNDIFFTSFHGLKIKHKSNITDAFSLQCKLINFGNFQFSGNFHNKNINATLGIFPKTNFGLQSKLNFNSNTVWSFSGYLEEKHSNLDTSISFSAKNTSANITLARTTRFKAYQDWNNEYRDECKTLLALQLVKRLQKCWILGVHLGDPFRFGICRQLQNSEAGILAGVKKIEFFYYKNVYTQHNIHVGIHFKENLDSNKSVFKIGIKTDTAWGQWRCFVTTEGILGLYFQTPLKTGDCNLKLSCLLNNGSPRLGVGVNF